MAKEKHKEQEGVADGWKARHETISTKFGEVNALDDGVVVAREQLELWQKRLAYEHPNPSVAAVSFQQAKVTEWESVLAGVDQNRFSPLLGSLRDLARDYFTLGGAENIKEGQLVTNLAINIAHEVGFVRGTVTTSGDLIAGIFGIGQ